MIIGAQLYTLRDFCKTPEDIHETLKKVADIGYTAVQMSGIGKIDYAQFKEYCDECGLDIVLTHMPFDRIVNHTEELIAQHEILGCDYIGIGAPTPEQCDTAEHFKAFADALAAASETIHAAGKTFCYHNHFMEFKTLEDGFVPMEYMIKTFPKHVNFTVDTYWVDYSGVASADLLNRLAGQIFCVHYKDLIEVEKDGKTEKTMAPVGEGILDWPAINKACEAGGTKWIIVEQDICDGDPFDCMKISYNNLKAMGYR